MAEQRTIDAEIRPKGDGYVARCGELDLVIERNSYDETLQDLEMAVDRKLTHSPGTRNIDTKLKITGDRPPYHKGIEVRILPTLEGYKGELYSAGNLVASCDVRTQDEEFPDMVLKKLREVAPVELSSQKWAVSLESSPMPRIHVEGISIDPAVCHGRPCIKGTRVMVSVILDCLAGGMTEQEILEQFPSLNAGDIRAVAAYAAELVEKPLLTRKTSARKRKARVNSRDSIKKGSTPKSKRSGETPTPKEPGTVKKLGGLLSDVPISLSEIEKAKRQFGWKLRK